MPTLAILDTVRNLRLQNRKLASRHIANPDLIRSLERPAGMAWRAVWSCVNSRGGI
ncbi:hypothetical protein [Aeromonas eucrenophila]|uniref:Uncharacterized protein n=1 Tax=Aeromonas eucrenophila TaxID=649 RepID=A0ABW0YAS8_9GAMM|nr:hypothetical protein [Aeromonas eucrenophila]